MNLGGFDLVRLSTVLQLIFLVIFLLFRSKDRTRNIFLALFLFSDASFILSGIFYGVNHSLSDAYLPFFYILFSITFLIGPAVYLYVEQSVNLNFRIGAKHFIHALPFVTIAVLNPLIIKIPSSDFFVFGSKTASLTTVLVLVLFHIHILGYLTMAVVSIVNANTRDKISPDQYFRKQWLPFLVKAFAVLWLVESSIYFVFVSFDHLFCWIKIVLAVGQFTVINTIVFLGLSRSQFLEDQAGTVRIKYKKALLSTAEREKYLENIQLFMKEQKPYRDPNFSLQMLSENVGLSPNYVSQILNSVVNKSFYEFVNHYRIQDSIHLLSGHKTVLEILYEVGFTSKSAFNSAFKKYTGTTPTMFRKSRKIRDNEPNFSRK